MFKKISARVQPPTNTEKLEIYSDGNDDYKFVLQEFFKKDCIDYGQLIKIRENGRVVDKIRRVIFGDPKITDIETTDVENFNGIIRERIGRFVRKTKCYGKKTSRVENALSVFQFHWNFMKPIKEKMTPAILENQATKI